MFREDILTNGRLAVRCRTKDQVSALLEWGETKGERWNECYPEYEFGAYMACNVKLGACRKTWNYLKDMTIIPFEAAVLPVNGSPGIDGKGKLYSLHYDLNTIGRVPPGVKVRVTPFVKVDFIEPGPYELIHIGRKTTYSPLIYTVIEEDVRNSNIIEFCSEHLCVELYVPPKTEINNKNEGENDE